MNSFIPEGEKNPVITLKAQAEKFDYSKLRASRDDKEANSGEAMYKDFQRMRFVINEQEIDQSFISALKKGDENQNYRLFAKEVFKEMFKYAGAQVPNDPILEELTTNCNQAAYVGALHGKEAPLFHVTKAYELTFGSSHTTHINCSNSDRVAIRIEEKIAIHTFTKPEEELCKLDSSLEFTLESQDGKDGVTYKGGRLSLTIPEKLRDYPVVNEMQQSKSLFDVIKEIFFQLIEKIFGHTNDIEVIEENGTITMTSSFGKPLKIKSTLKEVKPPMNDIKTTNGMNSSKKLH